jgi:hypothetical protein
MFELPSLRKLRHSLSSLPGLEHRYIIEIPALKRWAISIEKKRASEIDKCLHNKKRARLS